MSYRFGFKFYEFTHLSTMLRVALIELVEQAKIVLANNQPKIKSLDFQHLPIKNMELT